jgi:DNA repair exonuclease SbcCD nuclease subunit
VAGTKYPSGHAVEKGFDTESFSPFDLVLGGHIHLAQKFSDNIKGGYVGSVTQLKRDDAGIDKGFWHFKIDPAKKTVDSGFIKSQAPEYVVKQITFEKGDEYKALFKEKGLEGNYFFLRAKGNRAVLSTVDVSLIEKELIEKLSLRFCKVELEVERGTEFKYEELQESKSVDDEVNFLIEKEDITGLDKGELREVGLWITKEVA